MPPPENPEQKRVVDDAVSHGAAIIAIIEWLRGGPERQGEIEQIVDGADRSSREGQLEMTGQILSPQSPSTPQLDS